MSSKRRKEKSYSIHGMQNISSVFISRHQFAIKPYDSYATNRVGTGCLFRCLKQFGHVKKTYNGKFIDIKVHLYFKSWRVTINGVLDYIIQYKQFPKYIQYKQFPQYTQYKQFPQKEEKDEMEEKVVYFKRRKRGGWKRKWLISKKEEGGGKTKEKDIMKRRQEGGEEEKKMGTEEGERRRSR